MLFELVICREIKLICIINLQFNCIAISFSVKKEETT